MIYKCQFCAGWFSNEQVNELVSKGTKSIQCSYCGLVNVVEQVKTSHVAKGYDSLELGDFYAASMEFGEALKHAENLDISQKEEFLDAYLGRALAQHSVQVIYDEEIADPSTEPEINCYICNNSYLEDSDEYQTAFQIAHRIANDELRSITINRITRFAKKIDGIKRVYDRKLASGEDHQLFIACEEASKNKGEGLLVANKIRNYLPSAINRVYIQDSDNKSFEEYEGELLYALHHSSCMLVVIGNEIDSKLMNLYARYYWAMKTAENTLHRKYLGFVRYRGDTPIHLPEHNLAKNVFVLEEKSNIVKFIGDSVGIYTPPSDKTEVEKKIDREKIEEIDNHIKAQEKLLFMGAPIVDGQTCRFGSYPQRLITSRDNTIYPIVSAEFAKDPKPNLSSDNGWNVMFRSKTGQPYTWYKDRIIDGKKYRAVYFMKFREVYTIRPTDIMPSVQRIAKYTPMRIYIFSFDDIEWNILDISKDSAVLVSSLGLDCREFNNCQLCSDWESSSIRTWLNEDFFNIAFSDEQKQFLWHNSENESITILDKVLDFSNKHYRDRLNSYNIYGSDYLKCIGGFCDKSISNFWIKASTDSEDKAAAVQPHNMDNIVPQCVDNTAVSVLPLIRVKIIN